MSTLHFDTNVAVDLIRGKRSAVDRRFSAVDKRNVAISVVVLGELRLGVEKTGNPGEATALRGFLLPFVIVPADENVAVEYARLRARLERIGVQMGGNDLWIAATALVHNAVLVTSDDVFARVSGLKTENWRL